MTKSTGVQTKACPATNSPQPPAGTTTLGYLERSARPQKSPKRSQRAGDSRHIALSPPPVLRGRVREGVRASGASSTQPPPQPSPGVPGEGEKSSLDVV